MEAAFAVGQPVYHYCPALPLVDVLSVITTEGLPWIIFLAGAILLMACVFFVMYRKYLKEFEEKERLLKQIKECDSVSARMQDEKGVHVSMPTSVGYIIHACTHSFMQSV